MLESKSGSVKSETFSVAQRPRGFRSESGQNWRSADKDQHWPAGALLSASDSRRWNLFGTGVNPRSAIPVRHTGPLIPAIPTFNPNLHPLSTSEEEPDGHGGWSRKQRSVSTQQLSNQRDFNGFKISFWEFCCRNQNMFLFLNKH